MFTPKKILVLGSSGFIGKNLCPYLEENRFEIIRADQAGAVDVNVDALHQEQILALLEKYRPDCIINLIGYTDERRPDLIYKLNLFPFINTAESLIRLNIRARIILISSAAEFGEPISTNSPVKENDIKNPISNYGVAKLTQTLTAQIYHNVHGIDLVIGRPFNIIGNNMSPKLVPACFIDQFLKYSKQNNTIEIKTKYLDSVRDFISVEDVNQAILTIINFGKSGESYNICSGIGISISNVVKLVAKETSSSNYIIAKSTNTLDKNVISYSVGDNSKLKYLGWGCKLSTEEAVRSLVCAMKITCS
jgi:GDP-4-dehydro-6-deoxy-D-mannose reductase